MSQTIDEKVVALRFNNKQFHDGVQTTIDDVERLNKGLKLKDASNSLEKVAEVSKKVDMSKMEQSIDRVRAKIGTLQTMYLTAVNRMTNAVLDFGKKTIDMFAIHPVTTGFNEYELKMGSVQTIMASTGESVETVNKYLDELNKYSDKTIYSFRDMTTNIGKFTNAGVKLEDAVAAIKGISNEAAISGANANEASRAMYNFAQALSAGYVKQIDWRSIEYANMATVEFKEQLLQTAEELKTVARQSDGTYAVLTRNGSGSAMKDTIGATKNFNDSLQYQWMTSEVLTKTLAKYANEEEAIGKKAYAAAQDVKTFSMMVDTLAEAAQSGWAETWQLVVGDFEEAKKLFTNLKDIFEKIISSSADARNELIGNAMSLQNAKGMSGRQALWQSLLNVLIYVRDVIGAIKKGFFDVFPPITDQRLRLMIENLYNFTKGLRKAGVQLSKIRSIAKGVFAVLDIVITTIRFLGRVAVNTIKLVVNVLKTVLFAGFQLLLNWIEKIKTSDTGFNGWLNRIGKGIGRFVEHVRSLDGLSIDNFVSGLRSFLDNVVGTVFDFSWVGGSLEKFRQSLKDGLQKIGIDVDKWFGNFSKKTGSETEKTSTLLGGLIKVLTFFKDAIITIFTNFTSNISLDEFTFGKVIAVILLGSLTLLIVTTSNLIGKLSNVVGKLGNVFEAFAGTIKAFKNKIKAESLFTISKSLLVLTAALVVLSMLDPKKLWNGIAALGALAAGLVGVSIALSKVGDSKKMLSFGAIILSMAASIGLLSKTLLELTKLEGLDIKRPLELLVALSAGLVVVVKLLGSKNEKHYAGIFKTIAFVVSLRVLVGLLKTVTEMNLKGINSGLKTLFGLMGLLFLTGVKLSKTNTGAAAAIMAMAIGLRLTIGAIKQLEEIDVETINHGVLSIMKIFGAFAILIVAASFGSKQFDLLEEEIGILGEKKKKAEKSSSTLKDLGNAIIKISASLLVIYVAIKAFSKFTPQELDQGTSIVSKILLFFAAIIAVSKFAGSNAGDTGSMLLKMSIALVTLVGLMSIMTLFDDPNVLKAPMRIVEELLAFFAAIIALASFKGDNENVSKTIKSMTTAVIAISAVMAVLTFIKPEALKQSAYAMGLVMTTFALIVAASKFTPVKIKGIVALTAAVIAIGGVLLALSALPINNVLQNAGALGIVLAALAASMLVVSKAKADNKGLLTKLTFYLGALVIIGGILALMGACDVQNALENAAALSLVMASLSATMYILSKAKDVDSDLIKKVGKMAVIMTILQVVLSALNAIGVKIALQDVAALSVLMLAVSTAFAIFGKAGDVKWEQVIQLSVLMAAMAVVGKIMEKLDLSKINISIEAAVALGVLLAAALASLYILSKIGDVNTQTLFAVAAMAAVYVELGFVLDVLSGLNLSLGIDQVAKLSILLLAASAACVIASLAGKDAKAAFIGIAAIATLVAVMTLVMGAIGDAVDGSEEGLKKFENAVAVMGSIGAGLGAMIGEFIGALAGGVIGGTLVGIGTGLSQFSVAIQPFLTNMAAIDPLAISNTGALAGALLKLMGSEAINALTGGILGKVSMANFGSQLSLLADGLITFSVKTQDIVDGPHVDSAIRIIEKLVAIAQEIPNTGGLLGDIVGNNDMGPFAEQFPKVASGIVSFAYRTQNLTYGPHLDKALDVLSRLAAVAKEIPNTGGLLGDIVGNNDMGPFAAQMPILAMGIVSFAYRTQNITYGPHVDNACDAILAVARVAEEIPNTGGLLGDIVGNNDMRPFAEQLPIMGLGILGFANAIKGVTTGNVDSALSVARKLSDFSKDLSNTGGLWQDIFGEVSVEEFGRQITWLGKYLWIYSSWIDYIKDFSKFEKSVEATKMLAEMADIVSGIGKVDFETFGKKITEYAETSLVSFVEVFDKADTAGIGTRMGDSITKSVESTASKLKFVKAASTVMTAFIATIKKKIYGSVDTVESAGRDISDVLLSSAANRMYYVGKMTTKGFVNGLNDGQTAVNNAGKLFVKNVKRPVEGGLDVNSPSKWAEWVGKMVGLGFIKGVDDNKEAVGRSGELMAEELMERTQDKLGVHSLADWGIYIGNMTTGGIEEGVVQGAKGLFQSVDNMWGTVQSLSEQGVESVENILGEYGLWDAGASAGENIDALRKTFKNYLGFGSDDLENWFSMPDIEGEIKNAEEEIQNAFGDFGGDIGGNIGYDLGTSAASSALSSLSEQLKLSMHKHFDYSPFIYLGKQLGDTMAIAANNAIVGKEKVLSDTMAEALDVASGGIDVWKAWAEERKYYSKLSLKDELAGWEALQKMYEEGTKERMEADKEVYTLQQDLVKQTFEYSKNWIDNEKYYNRLSLEEELAAWERIQKRYLEGSEERIEADKQVYTLREELRQKDYENAKKWIEKEKKLEKLSLADELAAYKRILQTTKEGSDEREETEETIFDLQKEIYEAQQQYIEDIKSAQKDAADERLELEQEYSEKVRQIEEQLASDIQSLNDNYMSTLEQRAKTLYKAYGLFDEVTESEADKDELMKNMEDQVKAFSDWKSDIDALSKRGLDKKLIDELTEMGPSSAAQIKALNSMTNAELSKYNLLWSQKMGLAREQAIGELEYLRVETADNITKLQEDAAAQLDEYRTTWANAMKQVTVNCNKTMNDLRKDFGEKVGLIGKDTQKKLNEIVKTSKEILNAAGWDDVGKQIDNGIIKGVQSRKQQVLNTITQLGIDAVKALNKALEIASPSKATYRSGSFAGEGLVNGLEVWREKVYKSGYALGDEIQNGTLEAFSRLSDALSNDVPKKIGLTPVLTMGDSFGDIDSISTSLDLTSAVASALGAESRIDRRQFVEFQNPNENVVQELHGLRSDMARMNEELTNMKIVLDTGKVVGELTGPLDTAFGTRISRNMREKG